MKRFSCLLILLLFVTCQTKSSYPDKPNILFILVDDLGKEWISCYGAEDIRTPNIDQLAATGMQFANAYCMPQCTPTRITLMTGQYPYRHGWVNHWDVPRWGGGCSFDPGRNPSIARIMQSAGYKTAAAGKWQVNDFRVQPDIMPEHGFDEYCMWTGYETGNPASAERYWHPFLHTVSGSRIYPGQFSENIFTDFLINFMSRHKDDPLFMYYPMCLTHTPFTGTPAEPSARGEIGRHKAMVRFADMLVGKLLAALDSTGIRDRTIIFFTADNGTTRNVTGGYRGRQVSGGKSQTTENGICVPYIVNGPGLVPAGVKTEALTDFTDILPTCAGLAGVQLPADAVFDGVSIADLLLGKADDSKRQWILSMGGGNHARLTDQGVENMYVFRDRVVRDKRYKLYIDSNRQPVRFIDLLSDPEENNNIINQTDEQSKPALRYLSSLIDRFPDKDADPVYTSLPEQPWDVGITANSQVWKK